MPLFAYHAKNPDDGRVNGSIVADTPRQARDKLRTMGLVIEDIRAQEGTSAGKPEASSIRPGVSAKGASSHQVLMDPASDHSTSPGSVHWLADFALARRRARIGPLLSELATLLGAGVPMLQALSTLARQHHGWVRRSILQISEIISRGGSLSEAMRRQPGLFDDLSVNLAEVGQISGTLDQSLRRLADYKDRASQLQGRIGTALIYPCIVILAGLGVCLFLMTHVVPTLLDSLVQADRPIPLLTRIVKFISDGVVFWWPVMLVTLILLPAAVAALLRSRRGRMSWDRFQLKIPLWGELVRKQAVVRISMVLSTLLGAGVPFVAAVRIARLLAGNQAIGAAMGEWEKAVAAGRDMGPALEKTGAFEPMVIQVFSVGQQSGQLESMLDRLAGDYDRQVSTAARRFTAALEPLLIVGLACVVGVIVMAVIQPILQAGELL